MPSLTTQPLAYSMKGAAEATGVSVTTLEREIEAGNLNVRYVRSKRVIDADELKAWVHSRPYDRPEVAS